MTTIRPVIHDRSIEVPAPEEFPDRTEVVLRIDTVNSEGSASPEEIARVLAGMQALEPLNTPEDVAADLDAWERKLEQHGIERGEEGMEDGFS